MSQSDERFPIDQYHDEETGLPLGATSAELGRAITIWTYAQGRIGVTVGEAALAFNVTPEKVAEAVDQCGNPYFWIERWPIPLVERTFEEDGL